MGGALRAELLKLGKRPAVWVLIAVLLVTHVLFSYLLLYMFRDVQTEGQSFQVAWLIDYLLPQGFVGNALGGVVGMGGALALILSVLAVGSEYRWGTLKTIATQGPSRLSLGGAKLAVVGMAVLLIVVLYFASSLVSSVVIASREGAPILIPSVARVLCGLGAGWLILFTWATFGVVLAVVFRGTGLAIGLGLVYQLVVEGLLVGAVPWPERISRLLLAVFPGPNASSLLQHLAALPRAGVELVPPGQAAAVLAAYAVLFCALAGAIFRRRDIT